jgi:hypothetical protein
LSFKLSGTLEKKYMWKEFIGTNSHGNKNHCGHGNHDINDEQHK